MKIIFWGTPETAIPFLEFLSQEEQVVAVVTQTDKAARRGQNIQKSPVKLFAEQKKIKVLQPEKLKDEQFLSQLSQLQPEIGIVVAYGKILPKEVIQLFSKGIFNVHFSLLPHLRGAAPIQWAILRGDKKTGVTIFKISETLDTGNILCQKEIEISSEDNALSLEKKLIASGLGILKKTLEGLKNGNIKEIPQIGEISYAPLLKKEQAKIDWNKSAEEIDRQVRAFVKLGAFTKLPDGRNLKILQAKAVNLPHLPNSVDPKSFPIDKLEIPGIICSLEKGRGFVVKCKIGELLILKVQAEGKKEMDAWSFWQGARLKIGEQFS